MLAFANANKYGTGVRISEGAIDDGLFEICNVPRIALEDAIKAGLTALNVFVDKNMRHIPRGPRESTRNNPAHLTGRQVEILSLLEEGAQNKEIAEKLFISPKTVDHHISAILSKLSVNSRSKAVAEARKLGILK